VCLSLQKPSPPAAFLYSEQARIGQFTTDGVLLRSLAGFLRGAFHVEQVVRDLKDQTQASAKDVQAA